MYLSLFLKKIDSTQIFSRKSLWFSSVLNHLIVDRCVMCYFVLRSIYYPKLDWVPKNPESPVFLWYSQTSALQRLLEIMFVVILSWGVSLTATSKKKKKKNGRQETSKQSKGTQRYPLTQPILESWTVSLPWALVQIWNSSPHTPLTNKLTLVCPVPSYRPLEAMTWKWALRNRHDNRMVRNSCSVTEGRDFWKGVNQIKWTAVLPASFKK